MNPDKIIVGTHFTVSVGVFKGITGKIIYINRMKVRFSIISGNNAFPIGTKITCNRCFMEGKWTHSIDQQLDIL